MAFLSAGEFLPADGDENLAKYLETENAMEPVSDAFLNPLYEKSRMYDVTGLTKTNPARDSPESIAGGE